MAKAHQAFTESRITSPEVEKFMEMIVEECIQLCDEVSQDFVYRYSETKDNSFWDKSQGAEECGDELRKMLDYKV
jgi:hypothetical protein